MRIFAQVTCAQKVFDGCAPMGDLLRMIEITMTAIGYVLCVVGFCGVAGCAYLLGVIRERARKEGEK